jgi:hypothetical protein
VEEGVGVAAQSVRDPVQVLDRQDRASTEYGDVVGNTENEQVAYSDVGRGENVSASSPEEFSEILGAELVIPRLELPGRKLLCEGADGRDDQPGSVGDGNRPPEAPLAENLEDWPAKAPEKPIHVAC